MQHMFCELQEASVTGAKRMSCWCWEVKMKGAMTQKDLVSGDLNQVLPDHGARFKKEFSRCFTVQLKFI